MISPLSDHLHNIFWGTKSGIQQPNSIGSCLRTLTACIGSDWLNDVLEAEHSAFVREKRALPGSASANNKLSAKLTRQLEEPMIVAR
jgi:hypothetical protein